jgi:hypothetical protein
MRRLLPHLLCLPLTIAILWFSVRAQSMNAGPIVKLDPSLDQIFSADAKLELLQGEGAFEGGEGPLSYSATSAAIASFSGHRTVSNILVHLMASCLYFWTTPATRTHRAWGVWMPVERISTGQTG